MNATDRYHIWKIKRDIVIIIISIVAAFFISTTDFFLYLRYGFGGVNITFLDSLITGIFFTSVFTTPLAIASFIHIAETTNSIYVSLWGACGAVLGDIVLFLFIKDTLADDLDYLIKAPRYRKIRTLFRQRFFRWLTPFIGALVIASPLPDEIGIAMMGLSKMRLTILIPISFAMNFIGIYLIAEVVHIL